MVEYGRFAVSSWRERIDQDAATRRSRIREVRATIQRRIDDRQYLKDFGASLKETYRQAAASTDLGAFLRRLYEGKGGAYDNTG